MLKTPDRSRLCIKTRGHLLEVLYHSIVPSVVLDDTFTEKNDDGNKVPETDSAYIKRAVKALLRVLSSLTISLVQLVSLISDRVFKGRAAQFATQLARNLPSAFETVSIKRNVETDEETGEEGGQYCSPQIPPSRDELEIPSVYELCSAGVRFVPTEGDLSTVRFEPSTATLYLPRLRLDSSTEVVLRNLVAFEASAAPGDLVLSRYTDFMNGIIDTEKDVRLLRRRGIQLVISTGWVRTPFISVCLLPSLPYRFLLRPCGTGYGATYLHRPAAPTLPNSAAAPTLPECTASINWKFALPDLSGTTCHVGAMSCPPRRNARNDAIFSRLILYLPS